MRSRRPHWCPKTMKRRPCWCPKPVLWELNSFLMQTLSFVLINLHRCWPREWKHSIKRIFIVVCGCSRLWLVPSRLALPLTALPSLEDWQTAVFTGCMYIVGAVWLWYCWNCGFYYALQKDFCEHVRTGVIIAKKSETSSFDLVRIYQDKELVIMKGFVNSILNLQLS